MKTAIATLAIACLLGASGSTAAQSRGSRLFDLIKDKVEDKVVEEVAERTGLDPVEIDSPVKVEQGDVSSTRPRQTRVRVSVDPIDGAHAVMTGETKSAARGMLYPTDDEYIPAVLAGYTHVRRGGGAREWHSLIGVSTCDPNYIVWAKGGKVVKYEDLAGYCKLEDRRTLGGRKPGNPDISQAMRSGNTLTHQQVQAFYESRVAELAGTDRYYLRDPGEVWDVPGGVLMEITASFLGGQAGRLISPHVLPGYYRTGERKLEPRSITFFIPVSDEEKARNKEQQRTSVGDFFNKRWNAVFFRIPKVEQCGDRYLVHLEIDEVRYHMGRGPNAPYRSWTPGSPHTQANGLPKDARMVEDHSTDPYYRCPQLRPAS